MKAQKKERCIMKKDAWIEIPSNTEMITIVTANDLQNVIARIMVCDDGKLKVKRSKRYTFSIDSKITKITIHVPSVGQIITIQEGDGSNLSKEDEMNGFVDYIHYEQYDSSNIEYGPVDGGLILQKEMIGKRMNNIQDVVREVLDFAYTEPELKYIVLSAC